MKWADYCISKLSLDTSGKIKTAFVYVNTQTGNTFTNGASKDRNWLTQQAWNGKSFCTVSKTKEGSWVRYGNFEFVNGSFRNERRLPNDITNRKTFVSYYHRDDQVYRERFVNLFGDLVVSKSVENNDIDTDKKDEYIKQLIQKDYLRDTTVLAVLVGPNTRCRKHVDWEIAGGLNVNVGGIYTGLIGLLLPSHPDYGKDKCNLATLPVRLAKNLESGYAALYNWTEDRVEMQNIIEEAYKRRKEKGLFRNNSTPQMQQNSCD